MEIRKKEPTVLGPAESTYDDWKGTACAENSMIIGSGDLYALAGLDGERDRLPPWNPEGMCPPVEARSHRPIAANVPSLSHKCEPRAESRREESLHLFYFVAVPICAR